MHRGDGLNWGYNLSALLHSGTRLLCEIIMNHDLSPMIHDSMKICTSFDWCPPRCAIVPGRGLSLFEKSVPLKSFWIPNFDNSHDGAHSSILHLLSFERNLFSKTSMLPNTGIRRGCWPKNKILNLYIKKQKYI